MTSRKKDFKSLMERQLAELHERMTELENLSSHKAEHATSYDTVECEARSKHIDTLRRLGELDDHGDDTWETTGEEVKAMIAEIRRTVEAREAKSKK